MLSKTSPISEINKYFRGIHLGWLFYLLLTTEPPGRASLQLCRDPYRGCDKPSVVNHLQHEAIQFLNLILIIQISYNLLFSEAINVLTRLTWLIHTSVLPSNWDLGKIFALTVQLEIRQSTIYYAVLLGWWDKRIVDQESDVPSIICFYTFYRLEHSKLFISIFVIL